MTLKVTIRNDGQNSPWDAVVKSVAIDADGKAIDGTETTLSTLGDGEELTTHVHSSIKLEIVEVKKEPKEQSADQPSDDAGEEESADVAESKEDETENA
jgi:hypothetical protein